MKLRRNLFLGSLVVVAFGAASSAHAGFIQTGAGPFDYNTTGNWASGTIDGTWASTLTLTAAQRATFAANTVLTTGLTFNYAGNFALTLDAAAAGTNTITLAGGITLNTTGGTTANVTIGGTTNHLDVNLGGVTQTMSVAGSRTLTLHDVVSNGGITKTGTGTLRLNGANTLGDVAVNDGTLFTEKSMTFGNLSVAASKTFQFGAQDAVYTINIKGLSGAGTVTTANSGGNQRNLILGNNDATADFSGVLTQASNRPLVLTKLGAGTQTLSGSVANTQAGGTGVGFDTYIQAGTMILNKTAAIALPGDVFINGGALQLSGTGDNQIDNAAAVNWSSGTFDLNGRSETIGALTVSVLSASANQINVAAGKTFTAAGNVNIFNSAATTLGTNVTFNSAGSVPTSTFAVTGASSFIFGQDSTTSSTTRTNTLDMRNLGVFNAGTSGTALTNFVIGNYVQATGSNYNDGGIHTAYLAPSSTIYSTSFGVGDKGTGSQPGQYTNTLYLGSGTTAIHATTITVGEVGAIDSLGSTIKWNTGVTSGALTLNGTGVTSAVTDMFVGYKTDTASASAGTRLGTVDLSNGTVTGSITNLYVGYKTTASDSGTAPATTTGVFKLGAGAAGASSNLTIGNLTLAHSVSTASTRNNPVNGTFQLDGGTVNVTNNVVLTNESAYDQRNGTLTINGGVMTIGGNITSGITRTTSLLTLSGGTLDMTGGLIGTLANPIDTFTINPGTAATLKNVASINGAAGITKTGAGILTLEGTNTYTGATAISVGTVKLGAAGAIGDGTNNTSGVTVSNLAALDLNSITPTANTVALNLNGTTATATVGALTNSTSTAATWAGTVTLQTASSIGSSSGNIILSGPLAGALALTKVGSNTLILSGATNGTTTTTISAGTLQIGNAGTSGLLGSGAVTDNGTLVFNRTDTYGGTVSNAISGTGAVTLSAGTLTLGGTNSYAGTTTISAGTLKLGAAGSGANSPLGTVTAGTTVAATGAALDLNGFTLVTAEGLTLNGTGISSGGALTNSSSTEATYSGLVALGSASSIVAGSGNIILSNAGTISGATYGLTVGGGFNTTINSIIGTTTGTLTKQDAGTLTLSNANTYSGGTTISAGIVTVSNAGGLGSGNVANNATLNLTAGGVTYTGLSNAGVGALSGNGTVNVTLGTVTASTLLNGNYSSFTGIMNIGTGAAAGAGKVQANGADNASATYNVLNHGTLYITSGGTRNADLTLGGGDTGESLGQLRVDTNALDWAGAITLTGSVTGSGDFTFGGNNNLTISGGIGESNGSQVLKKGGGGTLIIASAASYSGTTTVSGGTLQIGNGGAVGTLGSGAVANAGTLVFNRNNTYTLGSGNLVTGAGAVRLNSGTVAAAVDNQFNTTGSLTFGASAGATTVAGLDLSSGSSTFASMIVQTDSASANTLAIGTGKTLQINGAVTVGYNSAATSATKLTATGLGTLSIGTSVTPTNANVQIGNGQTASFSNGATLDMSGLSTFYANLGSGTFRVGDPTNSTGTGTAGSTLILAAASTIQAATLTTDSPAGAITNAIKLGSGTNILNVNTLTVGGNAGRSNGTLTFNGGSGTLKVRSQSDPVNGRATLNVGNVAFATGISQTGNVFNTNGHTADLYFGTMTIGSRADGNGDTGGVFSFDTGTLDANALLVGNRTAGADGTATTTGIVNLGGGAAVFNSTAGPVQLGTNESTTTGSTATGTLNVSGGTVTVAANAGNSFRLGHSSVAGGTANGTINVTGSGTLTVAGDIIRGSAIGTSTATLNLNGGTLDMGGNEIGGSVASSNLTSLTFASGTLKNVAQINNGADLNKTTVGTLIIDGTNTYTGATTVTQGTLIVNGNISTSTTTVKTTGTLGGKGTTGPVTVENGGTLAPGTSPDTLSISGTLGLNDSSILAFEFNPLNMTVGGTINDWVNITGDLTLDGLLRVTATAGNFTTVANGSIWRLFNYSGTLTDSTLALDTMPGLGIATPGREDYEWFIDTATPGQVNLVVIPEPSIPLLTALGVCGFAFRRRRSA